MSKRIICVEEILILLVEPIFACHEQFLIVIYLVDHFIFCSKFFDYVMFLSLHHDFVIKIFVVSTLCVFAIAICIQPRLTCFRWAIFMCHFNIATKSLCFETALSLHVIIPAADCLL